MRRTKYLAQGKFDVREMSNAYYQYGDGMIYYFPSNAKKNYEEDGTIVLFVMKLVTGKTGRFWLPGFVDFEDVTRLKRIPPPPEAKYNTKDPANKG